jgi:hypothetical protein
MDDRWKTNGSCCNGCVFYMGSNFKQNHERIVNCERWLGNLKCKINLISIQLGD